MLSKKQIKFLKKYKVPMSAEKDNPLFHELTRNGFIDIVNSNAQELYRLTSKGFAELESAKHNSNTTLISIIALGVSVIGIILTFIFEFG